MKKFLSLFALLAFLSFTVATSQETAAFGLVSKKGVNILPEAGDIALGIDATPFLSYIGGFFSNSGASAPVFTFTAQNPGQIFIRKFMTDRKALRAAFRIGFYTATTPVGTDPEVDIKFKESAAHLELQVGMENSFLYKSRVRGYYGAAVMISKSPFSGYSAAVGENVTGTISYKDAEDSDNDFKEKGGMTIGGGLGAILGVEVFIAPKISLSGEFNVGLMISNSTDRIYTQEGEDDVYLDLGGSVIGFDNVASGALCMHFFF
jgi:hypothetical protein